MNVYERDENSITSCLVLSCLSGLPGHIGN